MSLTKEQLELQAYLEKRNEESRKQAEKKGATIVMQPTTDPEHWAKSGIYTVEQYRHQDAIDNYCETYRERHNIKPRWVNERFKNMTADEVCYEVEKLKNGCEEQAKKDAAEAQKRKEANKHQPNDQMRQQLEKLRKQPKSEGMAPGQ